MDKTVTPRIIADGLIDFMSENDEIFTDYKGLQGKIYEYLKQKYGDCKLVKENK
tara:strand:+ start:809 stop:970 length:162 start_codon:yes stop_codon:yes gene_type:complete